ncbi:MAG TPA: acyl-ACP--UDP-N-acetylglucosamine O-acyltransferase [Candidatus Kapabacteria bacterium]|nr:acyl-ACP--UDP-N-acetylglucosamine O-acyltransferase [Candidatus Kapabacteria bacterium]
MAVDIHPTAIVDPKAELADGVTVGPYAIIEGGVEIGENSKIHHHAFIGKGARIGKNCQIHHAAVVSNVPQDLKFKGTEATFAEIGDNTVIREFATIHRATEHSASTNAGTHDGVTRVGKNCLIMCYTHIAHDCFVGDEVIISNAVQVAGHVTIEKWATIGGGCLVHQFSLIGSLAMIGGGAQVRKDIPPYSLSGGADVRFSGINKIGLQRRGSSVEAIQNVKTAYTTIYHSGLNVGSAIAKLKDMEEYSSSEVQHIVSFIESSKRGVIGAG